MLKTTAIVAVVAAAGAASAGTVPMTVAKGDLTRNGDRLVETRFKAATTNWDSRIATNGMPVNSDTVGHVANGRSSFEGQTYSFELSFNKSSETIAWTITRPNSTTNTITFDAGDSSPLNTFHIYTTGSRGAVDIENLTFSGFGGTFSAFANLDVAPGAGTFRETFVHFGNGFDLLADDWSLTGDIGFDKFTKSNPDEGAKITVRAIDASVPAVPAPTAAAAGLLGLGGLAARRRR